MQKQVGPAVFEDAFLALTGHRPMLWQRRFHAELTAAGLPAEVDLPTGLGKTSVMAIWLIARAGGASVPRRLVYVVDRRAVVDQATAEAIRLREALEGNLPPAAAGGDEARLRGIAAALKQRLGLAAGQALPISTLRGRFVDNREWLADPAAPAIVVGTVDMIGSRLLFSGYGVSRKMRPFHAGLLGSDTLLVLDEAHLVPPFAHLLAAVAEGRNLRGTEAPAAPPLACLPLSATRRERSGERPAGRAPFRLTAEDETDDPVAARRLSARKRLRFRAQEKDPDRRLSEEAWALANAEGGPFRVVVFCDRRERKDDGSGASAMGVRGELQTLIDRETKRRRPEPFDIPVLLLVGGRRVHEREQVAGDLDRLGFTGGHKQGLAFPAFLVATAAGEVGVDVDAEHMVCDLVAWERMVQRLGRVNRRGEGSAEVRVFVREGPANPADDRSDRAAAARWVVERLPSAALADGETEAGTEPAFDASPAALRRLAEAAMTDLALKADIAAATTPEPLRPALTRPLLDAWSLTTLENHPGRPEVAPWLRGWVEDEPQTVAVWRHWLPVALDAGFRLRRDEAAAAMIASFLEAAAPHESEKLETESIRFAVWLEQRAVRLLKHAKPEHRQAVEADKAEEENEADHPEAATPDAPASPSDPIGDLRSNDVAAIIRVPGGAGTKPRIHDVQSLAVGEDRLDFFTLDQLGAERKGRPRDIFREAFQHRTVLLDARLAGLRDGLLDDGCDTPPETADHPAGPPADGRDLSSHAGFRVLGARVGEGGGPPPPEPPWHRILAFPRRVDAEGLPKEFLLVEQRRPEAGSEDAKAVSEPQTLIDHQSRAEAEMARLSAVLGLPGRIDGALRLAAALHDEGKRAPNWQNAFKARRDAEAEGLAPPLAKTRGPINQAILAGYRHEHGSLPRIEADPRFRAVDADLRDLILHVVAAHHGNARPTIGTDGAEEPPSVLAQRAREIALRFARLQKRWGPWGLAWWEALLRAADQTASRDALGLARDPAPPATPAANDEAG